MTAWSRAEGLGNDVMDHAEHAESSNMWLFFLFLSVPLIEIALFIQVGGWLGLWPTLGDRGCDCCCGNFSRSVTGQPGAPTASRSFDELRDPTETLGPWCHDPVFRCSVF
jgi:hypothetical protein